MATGMRRGMDWPTAWGALVPIYGVAAVLEAFFPAFAVPTWAIFVIYGLKVLDAARTAKDPWQGRSSPRPYLVAFVPLLVLHLAAFTVLVGTPETQLPAFGTLVVYWIAYLGSVGLAALFVSGSAPPNVRQERLLLRGGIVAEIASALFAIGVATAVLSGPPSGLLVLATAVGLAVVSFLGFSYAGHVARTRTDVVARKAPKA